MSAQPLFFVRLLALAGITWFTVELIANVLQTWDTFSPSYWSYYLQQQLARPLIGLGLFTVILAAARPLARRLSRDSKD